MKATIHLIVHCADCNSNSGIKAVREGLKSTKVLCKLWSKYFFFWFLPKPPKMLSNVPKYILYIVVNDLCTYYNLLRLFKQSFTPCVWTKTNLNHFFKPFLRIYNNKTPHQYTPCPYHGESHDIPSHSHKSCYKHTNKSNCKILSGHWEKIQQEIVLFSYTISDGTEQTLLLHYGSTNITSLIV